MLRLLPRIPCSTTLGSCTQRRIHGYLLGLQGPAQSLSGKPAGSSGSATHPWENLSSVRGRPDPPSPPLFFLLGANQLAWFHSLAIPNTIRIGAGEDSCTSPSLFSFCLPWTLCVCGKKVMVKWSEYDLPMFSTINFCQVPGDEFEQVWGNIC